jgi:hypothetical protein
MRDAFCQLEPVLVDEQIDGRLLSWLKDLQLSGKKRNESALARLHCFLATWKSEQGLEPVSNSL